MSDEEYDKGGIHSDKFSINGKGTIHHECYNDDNDDDSDNRSIYNAPEIVEYNAEFLGNKSIIIVLVKFI